MTIQDQVLAAMYKSFFADEARFDVLQWCKQNDLGQSAFSTVRDKLELDIGPGGRNLVDALYTQGFLEKRVGSEVVILPKGIDHVEANDLADKALVAKVQDLRFRLLDAIQRLQSESSDQSKAQVGRVMTETKVTRLEAAAIFKELEARAWAEAPPGNKQGWLAMTWEGAQALDRMRTTRPSSPDSSAGSQSTGGATPLSAIKFFD